MVVSKGIIYCQRRPVHAQCVLQQLEIEDKNGAMQRPVRDVEATCDQCSLSIAGSIRLKWNCQ